MGNSTDLKVVPDTSVIIDGRISEKILSGDYANARIFIPEAVVAEIEAQANRGLEIGYKGLEELQAIQELARKGQVEVSFVGIRPGPDHIKLAKGGEIDALIRSAGEELGAKLITGDRIQAEVARARGMDVDYLKPSLFEAAPLKIEDFFTADTMSVHLKNRVLPMAKKGSIRDVKFVSIRDTPCTYGELHYISRELSERARSDTESFVEISGTGASVLQIRDMRIAISNPPFSDDIEITAVRPVASVRLEEYRLSDQLKERVLMQRGVLIAGPPGAGKSTFAAGLAIYLHENGYVVKTMESPRDLQVPPEITQYAPLEGDMSNTADVLLLVRPDYTIYDEVRKTQDFEIFGDMRLAGVGMIGVVHANRPVDAVQRLIGRVELGIIPQVVDTIVFIDKGAVSRVQILDFTVKVPFGMTEADLARPVIVASDFESGKAEYEIYTYGEQVVVMPVLEASKNPAWKLAESEVRRVMGRHVTGPIEVDMISDGKAVVRVTGDDIPKVIGRGGSTIDRLENQLGLSIDVRELEGSSRKPGVMSSEMRPLVEQTKRHLILDVPDLAAMDVEIFIGQDYLFTATVSRHGEIKIRKNSPVAADILEAIEAGEAVTVRSV